MLSSGPSHLLFNLPGKCFPQIFPWLISHHSGFTSHYLFTKVIPTPLSETACLPSPFVAFRAFIRSQKLGLSYPCTLKCALTPKVRDPAAVTAVAPASSVIRALCTCRKGDCALNLKLLLWNFLLTSLYLHRILEMEGLFQRSTWPSIPWIWDERKKCQMHWPFRWMLKEKLSMMQLLDKDSQKTR